jgi:hypothetical protein
MRRVFKPFKRFKKFNRFKTLKSCLLIQSTDWKEKPKPCDADPFSSGSGILGFRRPVYEDIKSFQKGLTTAWKLRKIPSPE